ncbi:hypothetical protein [Saccharothrix sp. HUAS TT1]|uniref:hypothetical protein n=1 Tax=unclassified Saccharothrix TaxID=2593673 RepID=UPI00345C565D
MTTSTRLGAGPLRWLPQSVAVVLSLLVVVAAPPLSTSAVGQRWYLALPVIAALLVGLVAFLLYRGPRLEDGDRVSRTVVTGVSSWVLAILSSLAVTAGHGGDFGAISLFVAVAVVVPAGVMAGWQYLAAGTTSGRLRGRWAQAAVAVFATLLLASVQLLWFGLASGLLD